MSLENDIKEARKEIISDGYDMSVGEVMNLYKDKELIINPSFQRLFRWGNSQKTRFIESLLLGIPIPPIFVYQNENGIWELIDGLQRLSTIFEFTGLLVIASDKIAEPSVLEGTKFLPSLANKKWENGENSIGRTQQLQIKRARIRVEILKQESDPLAKYELFQRLNTGGSMLSEQEVRNCVGIMLNEPFQEWLVENARDSNFLETTHLTENAMKKQMAVELVLRFFAFRNIPYQPGLDVHEYLNEALLKMASSETLDLSTERNIFARTFELINRCMQSKAFKKWDGNDFRGQFLLSAFEVIAVGVSQNIDKIEKLDEENQCSYISKKIIELWSNETYTQNSGAGVRGTTRLANLLPIAKPFFDV